jgi:hypothetical protein
MPDKPKTVTVNGNTFEKEVGNITVKLVYAGPQSTISIWYKKQPIYAGLKFRAEYPFEEKMKIMKNFLFTIIFMTMPLTLMKILLMKPNKIEM